MERKFYRRIVVYADYFKEFKKKLSKEAIKKIYEVFMLIMCEEVIPTKFFKSITSHPGLYEIRVEYESNTYRIFCCFDNGSIVVLFNGFQKKSNKTPQKEIDTALRIMKEYQQQKL